MTIRDFKGAFWRGIGYRAARAAWAAAGFSGFVLWILVGFAVFGRHLHK